MKKILSLLLALILILPFLNSCKSNNSVKQNNENKEPPAQNIEYKNTNPGNIQSVPETSPNPTPAPPPAPTPAAPAAPPVSPKQPEKKAEPKPLGTYNTPLLSRQNDRVYNIKLAAQKINNYKLNPGDTFSFNDVVGKRDEENGFKVAAVIVNGEDDKDVGGGVCQLSGTIFNAADKAGLDIVERHHHSKAVSYVPEGRDAAVSYGYLDLKFKNNKNYPIEIRTKVENNKVYASIWKAK